MASPIAVPSRPRESSLIGKFTVLRTAPRELWVVYFTKVMEIAAYGLMQSTIVLWMSSDLGYTDAQAGDRYALWSTLITLVTLLVGSLTDSIGIKKSFLMGFWLCVGARLVMAVSEVKALVMVAGLLPLGVGVALMTPVMTTAVKAYSNTAQRSMAFSLFYTLMNVGFAISGWLFDDVRQRLGEHGTIVVAGMTFSTYRFLFLLAFLFTIPGLVVTLFGMRDGVRMTESGVEVAPRVVADKGGSLLDKISATIARTGVDTVRTFASVWGQATFYKFLGLLTLVVGVRLIFYHMHVTFPKFALRELGDGAPIGQLWGVLNPVLIVILVPTVGALAQRINSYTMMLWGTGLCALSAFVLAIPPHYFQGLADGWLGDLIAHRWLDVAGPVNPWYVSIALFTVIMSIGEALWSPRLYEYTAAIAPRGQEASYMALSLLPYFVAKFGVGLLSGRLLQSFVPAEGPRNAPALWLIVALMAAVCPVGLVLGRRWLQAAEDGRDS